MTEVQKECSSSESCEGQSFLMSKTQWAALLVAIAPSIPPLKAALIANPELAGVIVGGVFSVLRWLNGRKLPVLGEGGKKLVVKKNGNGK